MATQDGFPSKIGIHDQSYIHRSLGDIGYFDQMNRATVKDLKDIAKKLQEDEVLYYVYEAGHGGSSRTIVRRVEFTQEWVDSFNNGYSTRGRRFVAIKRAEVVEDQ